LALSAHSPHLPIPRTSLFFHATYHTDIYPLSLHDALPICDSIQLLEERLKRYVGSKMIVGGTPTIKGVSKMEFRVRESDMRVLPITCHACGENHVLDWDNVTWQELPESEKVHEVYGRADFSSVAYACPDCGVLWDDYERQKNIRDTVQKALDEGDPLCGWVPTRPFYGIAGFTELSHTALKAL